MFLISCFLPGRLTETFMGYARVKANKTYISPSDAAIVKVQKGGGLLMNASGRLFMTLL